MKIERKKSKGAEVYTASLNDIMFFLLLFFLIISTMVTPMAIRVMLPKSSTSEQIAPRKNVILTITNDLRYFIDDKEVKFADIEPTLSRLSADVPENQKPNVLLQIDMSKDIQSLVRIIDIGNRLGLKIVLLTEKD